MHNNFASSIFALNPIEWHIIIKLQITNCFIYKILPTDNNFLFGFITEECVVDRCGRFPCRHGGKCLPSDQGAICLCPLGFGGDLCEMRLDLQVTYIVVYQISP